MTRIAFETIVELVPARDQGLVVANPLLGPDYALLGKWPDRSLQKDRSHKRRWGRLLPGSCGHLSLTENTQARSVRLPAARRMSRGL